MTQPLRPLLAIVLLSLVLTAPDGRCAPPEKKPPRVDAHGDALPEGALARLGTIRFRDGGYFSATALSPDGKLLALASNSGTMRLLDAATGKEVRNFRTNGGGFPWMSFSPDGKLLAAVDYGTRIQFWEVATGNATHQLTPPAQGRMSYFFTFSGDGKYVATGSENFGQGKPAAYVWEVATGKLAVEVEPIHNNNVRVALSGDGKVLATTGNYYDRMGGGGGVEQIERNRTIQLWDVAKGKELKKLRSDEPYSAMNLAFSPDGKHLVTAGNGSMLTIWDVAAGKVTRRFAGRRNLGAFLAYSPDGKVLAAITHTNTLQLWDAASGKRLGLFEGPRGVALRVGFAPGGKVLAWGGAGQSVGLWDVRADKPLTPTAGHSTSVSSVAFAAGGKELLSVSTDGKVCFWDTTGKETRRMLLHDEESLRFGGMRTHSLVVVSPDGKHLLTGDYSSLCLWELGKGREVCSFVVQNLRGQGATFSPDGELLAAVVVDPQTRTSTVRLYDVNTGQEVRQLRGQEGEAHAVVFSPDGKKVVAAGNISQVGALGEVRAWDATSGKQLWQTKREGTWLQTAAVAPDGRAVAVAEQTGAVILLDTVTGKELRRMVGNANVVASRLEFAPDGRTVAVGGYRGDTRTASVIVWEVASGTVRQEFSGHGGMLSALAFSPDGKRLATGSADTTVLLWDLAASPADQAAKKLTAKELDDTWAALEVAEGKAAHAAMGKLIAAPADTLTLLQKQLKPVKGKAIDEEAIARWVADLDHRRFEKREQATRDLEATGKGAEKALRKALESKPSAEVRRRVQQLLDKLEVRAPMQETLRPTRALEVLERIGTAEAKQLLETLAGGASGAWLTEEAKASLRRLSPRAKVVP